MKNSIIMKSKDESKVNILFWNLHKHDLSDYIFNLNDKYNIDIFIFSETVENFEEIMNKKLPDHKYLTSDFEENQKVYIYVKNNILTKHLQEKGRYSFIKIIINEKIYNIVGLHLQSPMYNQEENRIEEIHQIIKNLNFYEEDSDKTVIIGDFNTAPFSDELIQYELFNSVLFLDLIKSKEYVETKYGLYKRFYNPMLSLISEDEKIYGSYFYHGQGNNIFWHFFDQCIYRKSMIPYVNEIKILKDINGESLIKNNIPDTKISDHLPLLLTIDGGKENGQ